MNTKLTLSIDKKTVGRAKRYAKARNRSLSNLVENYLKAVTVEEAGEGETTPLVAELSGVVGPGSAKGRRSGYADYLTEKYR